MPEPVILSADLFMKIADEEVNIHSAAISTAFGRIYIGLSGDDERRLNLLIAKFAGGRLIGREQRYRDSPLSLPPGKTSAVKAIVIDDAFHKLFVLTSFGLSPLEELPPSGEYLLTVYDLDHETGEPQGKPRAFSLPGFYRGHSLARHPTKPILYIGGYRTSSGAVAVYDLDPQTGWPCGNAQIYLDDLTNASLDSSDKYSLVVYPAGTRLYVGTVYRIQVVVLDTDGRPQGVATAIKVNEDDKPRSIPLYIRYTQNRIWYASKRDLAHEVWTLQHLDLDAQGDPLTPPVLPSPLIVRRGEDNNTPVVDVDSNGNIYFTRDMLFSEAFSGESIRDGVRVVCYDVNTGQETTITEAPFQAPVLLLMTPNETPLLFVRRLKESTTEEPKIDFKAARTRGHQLRLTVLNVEAAPGVNTPSALGITIDGTTNVMIPPAQLMGSPLATAWLSLDAALTNRNDVVWFKIKTDTEITRLRIRVEIAHTTDLETSSPITAVTRECEIAGDNFAHGHEIGLLIPGYGFHPFGMPDGFPTDLKLARIAATQFLEGWAQFYLDMARSNALEPWERPRQFIVTCNHMLGGHEASLEQLHAMAETLATLGFNTVTPDQWGAIPVKVLNDILAQHGLRYRTIPALGPDDRFPFDYNAEAIEAYSRAVAAKVLATDYYIERLSDVVDIKLWDEPGWYYPQAVDSIVDNGVDNIVVNQAALSSFHAFLRRHGMTPQDFGHNDWNMVKPLDIHRTGVPSGPRPSRSFTKEERRLFYWTMRFFPEAAAHGFRMRREALQRLFGKAVILYVNCNDRSEWYRKQVESANPAQRTAGRMDWLLSGRLRAFTPWTEDGSDHCQIVQYWSYYADLLRSAAMLGDGHFGSYTRGTVQGLQEHDAAYRILSLVGAGAKIIDLYTFGQRRSFPDGWSEHWRAYSPIAEALRLVGRGERLLYPGKPARGNVALLMPGSSFCWDAFPEPYNRWYYPEEIVRLHFALVHAGYQVDLIDETDILDRALEERGYCALYVTGPNVETGVFKRVETWVSGGGTLVVMPSAMVANEYDEDPPIEGGNALIDTVLGLEPRDRIIHEQDRYWLLPPGSHAVEVIDALFAKRETFEVRGPLVPLVPTTARVLAVSDGQACITVNTYGNGVAFAYAYYPGLAYWITGQRHCRYIPNGWGKRERDIVVQPLRQAAVPRSAFANVGCVEVRRLDSAQGIALVVLDWTGDGAGTVQVSVTDPGSFAKVSSVTKGSLRSWRVENSLLFELDIHGVDVVLIEC